MDRDSELLSMTAGQARTFVPTGPAGRPPAVVLMNPKYAHNVGAALRACSCYGVSQLWITGGRVSLDHRRQAHDIRRTAKGKFRLPREERMKGYGDVTLYESARPFDAFQDAVPVAVELLPNCESLPQFEHPPNAVYVFGPEDGGLGSVTLRHCHRFVAIPARHCLNLAAAVYTVLYDRQVKLNPTATLADVLVEPRGFHAEEVTP
jgi:tRNA C32,U32 (ribose-2'-O)-methylase TrmJ